jgi:hypothetical protein
MVSLLKWMHFIKYSPVTANGSSGAEVYSVTVSCFVPEESLTYLNPLVTKIDI